MIFMLVISSIATAFDYYQSGPLSIIYYFSKWIPILMSILLICKCHMKLTLNKYKTFVFIAFFEMLAITGILFVYQYSGNASYISIGIYMIVACLGSKLFDSDFWQRAFEVIAVIGIVAFLYFLLFRGFDTSLIIGREWSGYVWSEAYYYCNILWVAPYLVVLAFVRQKKIVFSVLCIIVYLAFNLIFLKRFALLDIFIVAILVIYIRKKQNKMTSNELIKGAFLIAIIMIVLLLMIIKTNFGLIFNSLLDRFASTIENISNFDRFIEIREYFKQAGLLKSFLGGGFVNSFVYGMDIYGTDIERYNLHIGWADYIYHGGIVFFLCMFLPIFRIRKKSSSFCQMSETDQFYFCAYILTAFRFLYIGFYVFYPLLLLAVLSAISMMKSKRESIYEFNNTSR